MATERELRDLFQKNLRLEKWAVESEVRALESREEAKSAKVEVKKWQRRESYFRSLLVVALDQKNASTDISEHPSMV